MVTKRLKKPPGQIPAGSKSFGKQSNPREFAGFKAPSTPFEHEVAIEFFRRIISGKEGIKPRKTNSLRYVVLDLYLRSYEEGNPITGIDDLIGRIKKTTGMTVTKVQVRNAITSINHQMISQSSKGSGTGTSDLGRIKKGRFVANIEGLPTTKTSGTELRGPKPLAPEQRCEILLNFFKTLNEHSLQTGAIPQLQKNIIATYVAGYEAGVQIGNLNDLRTGLSKISPRPVSDRALSMALLKLDRYANTVYWEKRQMPPATIRADGLVMLPTDPRIFRKKKRRRNITRPRSYGTDSYASSRSSSVFFEGELVLRAHGCSLTLHKDKEIPNRYIVRGPGIIMYFNGDSPPILTS